MKKYFISRFYYVIAAFFVAGLLIASGVMMSPKQTEPASAQAQYWWISQTSGTTEHLRDVNFADANTGWAVGDNGTILKYDTGTWSSQTSGVSYDLLGVHFVDANTGWAVGDWGTILKYDTGTWSSQDSGVNYILKGVHFVDVNTGWAVGSIGTILKYDGITGTWSSQTSGTSDPLHDVHFVDANTGWVVGDNGTILKTIDGGTNWTAQTSGVSYDLVGVHFVDANTGWAVGWTGTILKYDGITGTWSSQTSGTSDPLHDVHFVDANTGWVVGDNGTILKTIDGGTNWTAQTSGVSYDLAGVHFVDANTGWAAGPYGTILKYAVALPCNHTITAADDEDPLTPGTQITLTSDILNCPTHGLIIGTDDVTLDCDGNSITGSGGSGFGVFSSGKSNVTVKYCNISNFDTGIKAENSDSISLNNNTLTSNTHGANIINSPNTIFAHNSVSQNSQNGLWYFYESPGSTIFGNTITDNGIAGIYHLGAENSTIYNNKFSNSATSLGNIVEIIGDTATYTWNVDPPIPGINIIGGSSLGGNFWGNPEGTGYSDTCIDADSDGFCDTPYEIKPGHVDNLPLALPITCNHTITAADDEDPLTPGTQITLTSDILNCPTHGLIIGTDDVTLDCDGNSITGSGGSGFGVFSSGKSNVTVKYCNISNFDTGIKAENSDSISLNNNTLTSNTHGANIINSPNTIFAHNSVSQNSQNGLWYFYESPGSTIFGNTITDNGIAGIYHLGAENSTIYNNKFSNSATSLGNIVEIIGDTATYTWNVDPPIPGINIIGGSSLGGNFWGNPEGTGYSDTCIDADSDGFCDTPYEIKPGHVDNLPLVAPAGPPPTDFSILEAEYDATITEGFAGGNILVDMTIGTDTVTLEILNNQNLTAEELTHSDVLLSYVESVLRNFNFYASDSYTPEVTYDSYGYPEFVTADGLLLLNTDDTFPPQPQPDDSLKAEAVAYVALVLEHISDTFWTVTLSAAPSMSWKLVATRKDPQTQAILARLTIYPPGTSPYELDVMIAAGSTLFVKPESVVAPDYVDAELKEIEGDLYMIMTNSGTGESLTTVVDDSVDVETTIAAVEAVVEAFDTFTSIGDTITFEQDEKGTKAIISEYGVDVTSGYFNPYLNLTSGINAFVRGADLPAEGIAAPGLSPLEGAVVKAFDTSDTCVSNNLGDFEAINAACTPVNICTTSADGKCTVFLNPGNYRMIATHDLFPDMLALNSNVASVNENAFAKKNYMFINSPDGQKNAAKGTKKSGSELWIFEPTFVMWDDIEAYYPFVFLSDSNWDIDVCVQAPEGYQVADSVNCMQSLVANEAKSILFKMVEVGSKPGKTKVNMKIKGPHGKVHSHSSSIGARLSKKLAKQKGVRVDKYGRSID